MNNVIIFGIAGTGQKIYNQIKKEENVIYFTDNNEKMWGNEYDGIKIISPQELPKIDFDYIHIGSMCGLKAISEQLKDMGIPKYKLKNDLALVQTRSRILFLENVAYLAYKRGLKGAVAEAGVYKGEYAKEINRCFPDKTLYLFDTFEGFVETDIKEEKIQSHVDAEYLKDTSLDNVMNIMPHKEMCIVKKGFFPDTAKNVNENFIYVSLDMDLYKPTLEGIRYFYPRLVTGGIIAIHDFFSEAYPNIEQAVFEYEKEIGRPLTLAPVGDDISIAIIKY